MYEREINGYTFKWSEDGNVNVYRGNTLVRTFTISGVTDQKSFDKEISWWFMEFGNNLIVGER